MEDDKVGNLSSGLKHAIRKLQFKIPGKLAAMKAAELITVTNLCSLIPSYLFPDAAIHNLSQPVVDVAYCTRSRNVIIDIR